jgi:pimeloyl-ACP methyl ester carboxylesterase
LRLHYEEYGQGTPVLLVHGLGSSSRTGNADSELQAATG